jgi:hypothetical protein
LSDRQSRARERVEDLRRSKPGAAELAMLASLAVRIEPELLRALRLQVAPHLDAGAEADLWFSSVVQARGVDGITFSADVAEALRESLRTDARLPLAWQVIEKCHETISPALRLEEKVAWLALSGSPAEDLEEALAPALVALVKEGRTGLAPWAARALPRLPPSARSTRVAWVLSLTASQNLAGRMILEEGAPVDLLDEDLTGVLPDTGEIDLGIRRIGGKLEIGELHGDGFSIISVAETVPRLVEVRWEGEKGKRRKILSLRPGSRVEEEVGWGTVRLRTLTGTVYELPAQRLGVVQDSEDDGQIKNYEQFSIHFQLVIAGEYLVSVESPAGEGQTICHVSSELLKRSTFEARRESGREQRPAQSLGTQLWRALFTGEIRALFDQSLETAARRARGLRVRLRFGEEVPPEFLDLSWELLYWEERQEFLALSRRTPVVRSLVSSPPIGRLSPMPVSEPLRILVVAALAPPGYGNLKVEEEGYRIKAVLDRMPNTEVVFQFEARFSDFRTILETNAFQIIHFAGHGGTDGLIFENEEGGADVVSGATLMELLRGNASPRLVFLNASESAGAPGRVAESLLKGGFPAVVGMQRQITDNAALFFSEHFYSSVAAGRPVDVAMTDARRALYHEASEGTSWAVPVLLMNTTDGKLFERVVAAQSGTSTGMSEVSRELFDPLQLSTMGWGIIFAPDVGKNVREALRPLLELRRQQAGRLFKIFDFLLGQSAMDFLDSQGATPGLVEPGRVPYYLLIVGDSRAIPFEFQSDIGVQYSIERIWFERVEEYERYALSILRAEKGSEPEPVAGIDVSPAIEISTPASPHVVPTYWHSLSTLDIYAPTVPEIFVGRASDLDQLKERLGIGKDREQEPQVQILTAVRGWLGVGTTSLAAALARDTDVVSRFEGVLWASLGQQPNLLTEVVSWGLKLGSDNISRASNLEEALASLRALLRKHRLLLILDDVWDAAHAVPFQQVLSEGCALLLITSETDVARVLAPRVEAVLPLDVLDEASALELLRVLAPEVIDVHLEKCRRLVDELERLPLALQVAGRLLREEGVLGRSVDDLLRELDEGSTLLRSAAPPSSQDTPGETHPTLEALLERSTGRLDFETRERFSFLSLFATKPATFDLDALRAVWELEDPRPTVHELVRRGLLEPAREGHFQIHPLLQRHAEKLLLHLP